MVRRSVLVLGVVAGCGSGAMPAGDGGPGAALGGLFVPRDGTRLKAAWVVSPEGHRDFAGWYDNLLKADCRAIRAADGEVRCLPVATPIESAFADAACTAPLVKELPGCGMRAHAFRSDTSDPCLTKLRIYQVGERRPAGPTYRLSQGQCQEIPGGLSVSYRLGEELPPSTFVRMQRVPEGSRPPSEPVQLLVLEGEDGSREFGGFRLASSGERCFRTTLEDRQTHCVPGLFVTDARYADASCVQPLVSHRPACGPAPTLAQKSSPDACLVETPLYKVGPRVDATFQLRLSDYMCSPVAPASDREYRTLGERVEPGTYPVVDVVTDSGEQRLRRRSYFLPGGLSAHFGWFDAVRNEPCSPSLLDGKVRCVPPAGFFNSLFADDKCTEPLHENEATGCQSLPLPYTRVIRRFDECPLREYLYKVGAVYDGPVFLHAHFGQGPGQPSQEGCQPSTVRPGKQMYRTEPVASSELVEFQVVDPVGRR